MVDIDLRWGVTKQDADNGKAIEICLQEIDRSRPFFLCLLGSRYGWVPDELLPDEMGRFQAQTHHGKGTACHWRIGYDGSCTNASWEMSRMTFAEIEAAAAALPLEKQKKLLSSLEAQVRKATAKPPAKQSVLDIPVVSVGEILKPLTRDDDLLGEMLEGRM